MGLYCDLRWISSFLEVPLSYLCFLQMGRREVGEPKNKDQTWTCIPVKHEGVYLVLTRCVDFNITHGTRCYVDFVLNVFHSERIEPQL